MYLGGNLVSWCSKKQQVVSRSTEEVEYRSVAYATADVLWLESLLGELQVQLDDRIILWSDNSSIVTVFADPVLHSKFKHVELDLFFTREEVVAGKLFVWSGSNSGPSCKHSH